MSRASIAPPWCGIYSPEPAGRNRATLKPKITAHSRAIFRAASKASKAADFLLAFGVTASVTATQVETAQ
jgi:hypothetical protein